MMQKIILICLFLFTSYRLTKAEDELKIEVIEKPSEDKCQRTTKDGDTLAIHYTGRLAKTGKVFDSSRDRKEPFEFTLGKGMVIQGYEQGLKDMCVGEHRKLTIPSHLGKCSILAPLLLAVRSLHHVKSIFNYLVIKT